MLTIKQSREFFFDRQRVTSSVDKARRRNLARAGALVRTTSRRSIRKARRQRLSELSQDDRQIFEIRKDKAERDGRPKPKLPFAPSKPGEPPRSRVGTLRQHIYFTFDPRTQSVVVGPARFAPATGAPSVLEFSGSNEQGHAIQERPFMRPAEQKMRSQHVKLWKNCLK